MMMRPPQKRIARGYAAGATERLAEARTEIADLNAVHAAALRRNEELELALRETSAALRSLQLTNDERAFWKPSPVGTGLQHSAIDVRAIHFAHAAFVVLCPSLCEHCALKTISCNPLPVRSARRLATCSPTTQTHVPRSTVHDTTPHHLRSIYDAHGFGGTVGLAEYPASTLRVPLEYPPGAPHRALHRSLARSNN